MDPVTPKIGLRMARTPQRDNPRERLLRSELHRRGLRFRLHLKIVEGTRRTADFAFPRARVAVFVDGCFWHGCPTHGTWPKNNAEWWRAKIEANRRRDRDTDNRLARSGWRVVRIWEHDDIAESADHLERLVRGSDVDPVVTPVEDDRPRSG